MGRAPCCEKGKVKRGPWSPEEDKTLKTFLEKHGTTGNWIALPRKAGLNRCGKSCRLRWLNYLRPDIKHGGFTEEEDNLIWTLFNTIGSRWSIIASQMPGRTDNDVKNYWNTKLKKKLLASNSSSFSSNCNSTTTTDYAVLKIEDVNLHDDQGKSASTYCLDSAIKQSTLSMQIQGQLEPIKSCFDHFEASEFGSSSITSSTLSSSSSTIGILSESHYEFNYEDHYNGVFMEYMGIMGFHTSNDVYLSGFGF